MEGKVAVVAALMRIDRTHNRAHRGGNFPKLLFLVAAYRS